MKNTLLRLPRDRALKDENSQLEYFGDGDSFSLPFHPFEENAHESLREKLITGSGDFREKQTRTRLIFGERIE